MNIGGLMLSWKRPRKPAVTLSGPPAEVITRKFQPRDVRVPSESMTPEKVTQLGQQAGSVIAAIGCLTGNVAVLADQIHRRLLAGDLTDEQATDLGSRLQNIHRDIETACLVTTRARSDITPPAAHDDGHHGQEGGH